MTVTDQNAPPEGAEVSELPDSVEIETEEGRRLAEQLADRGRHARKLLEVRNLSTQFFTRDGTVHAVDEVSFDVDYGETLGIVGESGCGKSVTALSLVRLVPDPPGQITDGQIIFDGIDILKLSRSEMRRLRGPKIGFIFQDPMTSLNPTLPVGFQIAPIDSTNSRQVSETFGLDLFSRNWPSEPSFHRNSFGFVVYRDQVPCSVCYSCASMNGVEEIDVFSAPASRGGSDPVLPA